MVIVKRGANTIAAIVDREAALCLFRTRNPLGSTELRVESYDERKSRATRRRLMMSEEDVCKEYFVSKSSNRLIAEPTS